MLARRVFVLSLLLTLPGAAGAAGPQPLAARFFRCAPVRDVPDFPYPYPFPATPRQPVTVHQEYSGLGGTAFAHAAFPGASPSWGEATAVATSANVSRTMNAAASPGSADTGEEIGRSNEVWDVTSSLDSFSFNGAIWFLCSSAPCGGQQFIDYRLRDLSGSSSKQLPRFDPLNPDAYDLSPYAATSVNATSRTTYVPGKGSVSLLDLRADIRISQSLLFRQWSTTDVLAGRVHPAPVATVVSGVSKQFMQVLPPTPRFNFSHVSAGHLNQYHHFNWYQELTDYRRNSTSPADGIHLTAAELKSLRGWTDRAYGPDPALNSQFGAKVDKYLPYFDEEPIPGRTAPPKDFRWESRQNGLFFQDIPKLSAVGDQAFYHTVLVGVRPDGLCENLSRSGVANADEFEFRWSYRQTSPPDTGTGSIVQLLENIDETVPGVGEGEVTFLGHGSGGEELAGLIDLDGDLWPAATDNCETLWNDDQADGDEDGVGDVCDDCTLMANADQIDTDLDGYGNACDADYNQDGVVNFLDLAILRGRFFQQDPDIDLTGDGLVNFADLGRMRALFFKAPGPSGLLP